MLFFFLLFVSSFSFCELHFSFFFHYICIIFEMVVNSKLSFLAFLMFVFCFFQYAGYFEVYFWHIREE